MNDETSTVVSVANRRLAAIMFTDIVGFSRQMGADETHTLRLLAVHNQVIEQAVAAHQGHVIKTAGDGFLIEFPSVVHAVQCAQRIQAQFHTYNADKEKREQIHVRIGLHEGDILVQPDGDVLGDGVNIASRLQTFAAPDTICIAQKVYEEVEKKIPLGTVISLGRPQLKNITPRQRLYALLPEQLPGFREHLRMHRLKLKPWRRPLQVMAALLLLGLVSVGAIVLKDRYFSSAPGLPFPNKPSLVVLPFVNMSKDPEQEYFSDGITEDITSDLSRISSLFVIARNSAFTYKGKAVKVQDVSREMGVRYVLEGSVRKADNEVRITAQLIDATTGEQLWSERFDRPFKDIFALQDEIVQKIVTTLRLQLTLQERGWIVRKRTENLEAYDAFLRGMEANSRFTKESNVQARQMFEKAVALDSQYAEAYRWLSATYWLEWNVRWSADPQTLERALALTQQALALDDSLPGAHSSLSFAYGQQQQFDQAVAEGERAIALDPNNADSYAFQANVLSWAGRPKEALRAVGQAMRLNPRYPPWYLFELGLAYRWTGQYAQAIATLKESISRNPNFPPPYVALAESYLWQWVAQQSPDAQTLEAAVATAQRGVALNDSWHFNHINLGYISLYQRQYEQALAEMRRAVALGPNEAWSYAALAETLSWVGWMEDALEAATQALRLKPNFVDDHLAGIGTAYAMAGRYEEALVSLQRYLSRYPNVLPAHLTLAAVYSELGKDAEAVLKLRKSCGSIPSFR